MTMEHARTPTDDELVAYAQSKLSTSNKVSFWDSFAEPEIPQSAPVCDYNTGQMADGDVTAPPRMPGGMMELLADIDPSTLGGSNWRFQPLLNQTDDNAWSVTCYIVPPEGERAPHGVPRHHHAEDQVFIVLDGEVRQGNRRFGPGSGMFIPGGSTYGVQYGPQGARYLEIRHSKPADRGYTFADTDGTKWRDVMYPQVATGDAGTK